MLRCALALVLASGVAAPRSEANELIGGIGDIINGVLSIPAGVLGGTLSGPPILGTVGGALFGALNTVSLATRGVFRLLGVAIPLAAKVAPLLPVFL